MVSAADHAGVTRDLAATGLAAHVTDPRNGVADKTARLSQDHALRPRAIYVGDTEYDIAAARQAGYDTVGLTGGYRTESALRQAQPTALLHDLHQVVRFAAARR